jgi:sugar phosphate permease
MFMKGKMNSGMLAGVLNGFCYVGSTLSSYGLGALADHFGWEAVFTVLTAACAGCLVLAMLYGAGKRVIKNK